jgi:hypothetical protein
MTDGSVGRLAKQRRAALRWGQPTGECSCLSSLQVGEGVFLLPIENRETPRSISQCSHTGRTSILLQRSRDRCDAAQGSLVEALEVCTEDGFRLSNGGGV